MLILGQVLGSFVSNWLPTFVILDNTKIFFFLKNWSVVALQNCVSFCCTTNWFSHCINRNLPSWTSIPYWPPSHRGIRATMKRQAGLPVLYSRFPLALLHMVGKVVLHWGFPLLLFLLPFRQARCTLLDAARPHTHLPTLLGTCEIFGSEGLQFSSCFEQFRLLFHQLFILPAFPSGTPNYV